MSSKNKFSHIAEIDMVASEIHEILTNCQFRKERLEVVTAHLSGRCGFELTPTGSYRKLANIFIDTDGVELHDVIRSKESLVPFSDPSLFDKVRRFARFVSIWEGDVA